MKSKKEQLDELRSIVSTCTQCPLFETRTQAVFARGPHDAPLMVIGEAAGKDEDKQGVPFVGKSGRLLTELLAAARIPESEVHFTNVLRCRPPNNKFPEDGQEPLTCRGYLLRQIKIVGPKAIVLLGKQALRYVLLHETQERAAPVYPWLNRQLRRRDPYGDIRFVCLYHPSYLLRTPNDDDQEAWVQAAAQLWAYVQHRLAGTAPAPTVLKDIRVVRPGPRQGRNLFGRERGRVL